MSRGRTMKAITLLSGIGVLLSACAVQPDYGVPSYAYTAPVYGSADFDYGGGWGGWHHGWAHGHFDHAHGFHGGIGHGFGHAGFSGHGGGHGGGHR